VVDRLSVLVVDDVSDARDVVGFALEMEGYAVIRAETGREALERAAEHSPTIIIMDIQMPELDGIEATRRLKADRRLRHIPVIAHTAYPTEIPSGNSLFSAVLKKPCSLDTLLRTVARHHPAAAGGHGATGNHRTGRGKEHLGDHSR
jgi:two-component system response regulator VicR